MKPNELKDLDMSPARVMLILDGTKDAFYIGDSIPAELRQEFFPVKALYEPQFDILEIYVRRLGGNKND